MTEPSEERVEAAARAVQERHHPADDAWAEDYADEVKTVLAAADAVDTRDARIATLEAENERLRAVVDPSPLWEDDEPFDAHNESLRCGTAARLLDLGHLVEAAGTLYGVQSRIAQAALTPTTDTED